MLSGKSNKTLISSCVFGAIAGLPFVFGASHITHAATDFDDSIDISIATSCTMLGGAEKEITILGGQSTETTDSNIQVTCNNPNGYGIFAIGYSGNVEGNNKMLSDISSDYDIATGTATSGGTSNWAMKITGSDASPVGSFGSYSNIPTTWTKVAAKTSATTPATTVATTNYRIYTSTTQPAGTYVGKVKYILVNPSAQSCPDGYEPDGSGGCKKAVCVGYQKMQDIASIKDSLQLEVQTQLCDTRDEKIYWVAKLKDGNIWMTQNLDLDIPASGLSAADTNITTDWTTSSTYAPVATLTNASSYTSNSSTAVQSWDPGNYYYNGTSSTSCGKGKTSYSGCTGFSTSGNAHYHVGNMYSWNAATAGTGGTITSGQAAGSICPKGWRLPMSSGDPSFANLQSKGSLGTTVSKWIGEPYYFTRTGLLWYDSDKLYYAGYGGNFWSSTPTSNSSVAYYLYFGDSSTVYPANNVRDRAVGMSVRCVAGS